MRELLLLCGGLMMVAASAEVLPSFEDAIKQARQVTVSRDGTLHEGFPDLAMAANGNLVVVYQESESHGGGPVSTIVSRISSDQGQTWGPRTVVGEIRDRMRDGWLNGPRLLRLQDGSLLAAADCIPQNPPPNAPHFWCDTKSRVWFWRSLDHGRSWSSPEKPDLGGGIVPGMHQLRDGTILLGLTGFDTDDNWRQYHMVFRSTDNAKTWSGPVIMGKSPTRQPNEGDFVELAGGEVVCYMRDDEPHAPNVGLKAISRDGGRTWSELYGSGPWAYTGRPCAGLLSTGEVLITTRTCGPTGGNYLGAYLEPAAVALQPTPQTGPPPKEARWALLDNDTNPDRPDWGYSGWVELPDGSVFVVQYITADAPAPRSFIRGYHIARWQR